MRYDEFRDALMKALGEVGLMTALDRPSETIDLGSTTRRWQVPLGIGAAKLTEPFHVSTMISFEWDPFDSARTHTTEEDLVRELFAGNDDLPSTMLRHLRTDIVLVANLLYGSRTPMPAARTWRAWSQSVDEQVAAFLPTTAPAVAGRTLIVMGWRGRVEVESGCCEDGTLCLQAVKLPSWQAVAPPRILDEDDPDGAPEGDITAQLAKLAEQFEGALDVWTNCVAALCRKIRYVPPGG